MPVNLRTPNPDEPLAVPGLRLGSTKAGISKPNRLDLAVLLLDQGTRLSTAFTQNRFRAAPVQVCLQHLASEPQVRAMVINTGNANAGCGQAGMDAAHATCEALATLLSVRKEEVLPFSTGVIMEPLPIKRLIDGLPDALASASTNGWFEAAHAIMTTDTVAKACSRQFEVDGETITVTGMSKGSGMIRPNMATMLGFIATDAAISQAALDALQQQMTEQSFNRICVDGDTSTNDSVVLIATQKNTLPEITNLASPVGQRLTQSVNEVAQVLAQAIVRDGEGASKFISIDVRGARDSAGAQSVAYAVALSPLVKTAFFASDPNLGRILAAIGNADVTDLSTDHVTIYLGNVLVVEHGGRSADYDESQALKVMQEDDVTLRIDLGQGGSGTSTVWTCDLSHEYVRINAEYRS